MIFKNLKEIKKFLMKILKNNFLKLISFIYQSAIATNNFLKYFFCNLKLN